MTEFTDVLFDIKPGESGDLGVITLNRQQSLNALNYDMVEMMLLHLRRWQSDASIKAVIVQAAPGRAFCAGGDLRHTYDKNHLRVEEMSNFFRTEYSLNKLIYHFSKPYIALWDGITMGGGVGISVHGSHRVATEHLLFAMPETGIGFFPDVGGTYFLPRLRGNIGYYLGLTGARIKLADAMGLQLATHHVPQAKLPEMVQAIADTKFEGDANHAVSGIIANFSAAHGNSEILARQQMIDEAFDGMTMEAILEHLEKSRDAFCKQTYQDLCKKSPMSLKVTLEAIRRASGLEFNPAMQQEFRLATHFLKGHDFSEGIRAVIIDKDLHPKWRPSKLVDVQQNMVNDYFAPLAQELM